MSELAESVDELLREQRAERMPRWLAVLVAYAIAQSIVVIALINYFLATR